jgi:hypothetical protein
LLQNLPAVLFVVALVVAAVTRRDGPAAERFLSWILLLSASLDFGPGLSMYSSLKRLHC